jgi:hypothetical protein
MFKWLTNLFRGTSVPEVINEVTKEEPKVEQVETVAKPKKQAKKPASKKATKVDLDSMKKNELLAHAKANGIKANASMNKAALIAAIKNG